MRRIFSLVVAVILLISSVPQDSSASASDDITGHYFEANLRELISRGILGGYGEGVYQPDSSITRAEFANLVVKALKNQDPKYVSATSSNQSEFVDVKEGQWFHSPITAAARLGIVGGYPGNYFKPNQQITREEMAVMITRAIHSTGVYSQPANVTYSDQEKINPIFVDSIKRLAFLGVMAGKGENFAPKQPTTRGETAAVLSRMLKTIATPLNLEFKLASLDSNGKQIILREFDTFAKAKQSAIEEQIVLQGDKIAYMKSGMAVANKFTEIFNNPQLTGPSRTYVTTGTEFDYYDTNEVSVEVMLGNDKGYIKRANVDLIPKKIVKGRSHYTVVKGDLYHTLYNPITNTYASVGAVGKAPSFLVEGTQYYSWNGTHFYDASGTFLGESYLYFQHLPLQTKSSYTAEEIDRFLQDKYPDSFKQKYPNSPLVGTGKDFKAVEEQYGVNALYLMAHAIHESAWGTSAIARDKKNLFGMRAYDSNAYGSATAYGSFKASIEDAAKHVTAKYLSPKGAYYHGAVLGHKSIGMNVKYASDAYWGEKIAAHMYRADQFLGSKDNGLHKLAISNVSSLNIRSGYGTSNPILYGMKIAGIPLVVTEKVENEGAVWYRILSDDFNNRDGYVYGNGNLGVFVKEIFVN